MKVFCYVYKYLIPTFLSYWFYGFAVDYTFTFGIAFGLHWVLKTRFELQWALWDLIWVAMGFGIAFGVQ